MRVMDRVGLPKQRSSPATGVPRSDCLGKKTWVGFGDFDGFLAKSGKESFSHPKGKSCSFSKYGEEIMFKPFQSYDVNGLVAIFHQDVILAMHFEVAFEVMETMVGIFPFLRHELSVQELGWDNCKEGICLN
ncbi:uncharacterized protein A4U43_C01F25400 [Asparagus officinalis]|uniref:Uncharacterized protein n=1 Tax=Asparagus officinalis TaxID=4686 RepID=A0A5P1FVG4_ASPOF|nr:uncharacterized protein A4U43_C01F25400 [Asparagus officinalis]